MEKKYKLIKSDIEGLFRIKALRDFSNVKKGDIGGYVEKEKNLSQEGLCWIYGDAVVEGNAEVSGDVWVCGDAQVRDNAKVCGNAVVYGNAEVFDNACVRDNARVHGNTRVYGNAKVNGKAKVYGDADVYGYAEICGSAQVYGKAKVYGYAEICGDAVITKLGDYMVFQDTWSSGRFFTWTRSNNMWKVGSFHGSGEKLINKAYKDSEESGKMYEMCVNLVNEMLKEERELVDNK